MLTLAIDTSEARGSVALLRSGQAIATLQHKENVDYSEWLLPKVEELLAAGATRMEDLDLLAVATGPGSFTGLRVGLTTMKAWAEVYGKPVVGVSRLEAMTLLDEQDAAAGFVAAFFDAQRGQLFGALYRRFNARLERVDDEMVISPEGFLEWIEKQTREERVRWISLDPGMITTLSGWEACAARGDTMQQCSPELATAIGMLAEQRARIGLFTDSLELDANYVRRSDAEIFWKGR